MFTDCSMKARINNKHKKHEKICLARNVITFSLSKNYNWHLKKESPRYYSCCFILMYIWSKFNIMPPLPLFQVWVWLLLFCPSGSISITLWSFPGLFIICTILSLLWVFGNFIYAVSSETTMFPKRNRTWIPFEFSQVVFLHGNVAGSVCQHLLYKHIQPLREYDIYYFLSHIISVLFKVLINAFADEAFTPLRKAWNFSVPNEYHGLGYLTVKDNGTRRWESGPSKKSCLCDFFSLIFRSCHGRLVAIPGTQIAAILTTASQTPETSPVLWWSSGSKLNIRNCLVFCCKQILATQQGHLITVHNDKEKSNISLIWAYASDDSIRHQIIIYLWESEKKDVHIH